MGNTRKNNKGGTSTAKKRKAGGKGKSTAKSTTRRAAKPVETQVDMSQVAAKSERSQLMNDVIWGLILIALGAFIFAAVQFHAAGQFGNTLGDVLTGVLGLIGLILPWYMILLGVMMLAQKTMHLSWRTLVAGVILFMMLCLLNSGRFIDGTTVNGSLNYVYRAGVRLDGGGVFGMYVGTALVRWFGKAGLYIFSLVIAAICLLLIFKSPVSRMLETASKKKEERRILREEKIREAAMAQLAAEEAGMFNEPDYVDPMTYAEPIPVPVHQPSPMREKLSQLAHKERKPKKSNVLDFMTDDIRPGADIPAAIPQEPVIATAADPVKAPKKSRRRKKSDTMDITELPMDKPEPTPLEIQQYEEPKVSAKDVAKGAAEIGRDLGVEGGKSALTKGADKSGNSHYVKPPIDLLNKPVKPVNDDTGAILKEKAHLLEETMQSFNVNAHVVRVSQGPAVTRYEIQPESGVKVSKIVSLSDDIALNLRAKSIRMEAPIPGKAAVGIEIENDNINMVTLREVIDSNEFRSAKSKITFAVGKDIAGKPIVGDLKKMPHMLIAGSTGSGKSVCINSIITSIIYKADPDEVKMILIDPKVVELGNYNGIPHLLIPVVTDPSKAAAALSWAVVEMTNRYKAFAKEKVRDLASYNSKMKAEDRNDEVMPQVVIIIDELADLMMAAPSQVEESICRLAQMARAAGMHMIVATQRPSVDVITGVIKANIPSRIAFAVSSQVDSRTILDMGGAEHLVGKGDMLFNPLGAGKPLRVQGTFVSDEEVEAVIEHVKSQTEEIEYSDEVMDSITNGVSQTEDKAGDADELLPEAIECVVMQGSASVSMLQRRFRVGYNRAARIVDQMEARGIVGPQDGSRPRQVLMSEEEFQKMNEETNEG